MNLIKGCLRRQTPEEEQSNSWKRIIGCIVFDNWRPFTYMAAILDYKEIMLEELVKQGCICYVLPTYFQLENNPDYAIRMIKIPKFNMSNIALITWAIEQAVGRILCEGGSLYTDVFEELNEFGWK